MGLQVGPAFFAFSRLPFAARLRAAQPLSAEAGVGRFCKTILNLNLILLDAIVDF